MKRKTAKILLKTTANEVENLRNGLNEISQQISELAEDQYKNNEKLLAVQKIVDENNQKVEVLIKSSSVNQVAVTRDGCTVKQKVNRSNLEARDKEFLRKINVIKQAQALIRTKYEEQKRGKKNVWQKLLPNWVSFRSP